MVSNNVTEDDVCVCSDDNGAEPGADGQDGLRTGNNDTITESGVGGNDNVGAVYDSYDDGVGVTAGGVDNSGEGDVDNVGIVSDGCVNTVGVDDDETGGGADTAIVLVAIVVSMVVVISVVRRIPRHTMIQLRE